jgi:AraC-like DNA-binding protein
MTIEPHYPKLSILKEHIHYYYFLKSDDVNFRSEYYSFPDTSQALNIHKHAEVTIGKNKVHVNGNQQASPKLILQGHYDQPLHVLLTGPMDKITIIFKPIGINHFITNPYSQVASDVSQLFSEWNHNANYRQFLSSFFSTDDNEGRLLFLESFLLSLYVENPIHKLLHKAIFLLEGIETSISIHDIANSLNYSDRHFSRIFKEHTGLSPRTFRKIARFRYSLLNKTTQENLKKLTTLAYESNYYDQSYFIKIFKKLTNKQPAHFFQKTIPLANDRLFFEFINRP